MQNDYTKAVADSEKLIADLEQQRGEAQLAVGAIVDRRKPLALAATMGDSASRRALVQLADEERAAEVKARDLGFAVEAARAQLDKDQSRAADADLDERRATYATAAAAALDAARDMDSAALALVAARGRLVAAHAGMSATGVGNSGALNRLLLRAAVTRCLVRHGFADFAEIARVASPTLLPTFEQFVGGVVGAAKPNKQAA